MRHDSYNGASEKKAYYTDRMEVFGNVIFFDRDDKELISKISFKAENWLDFITGCDQYGFFVIVQPNGAFSVLKKSKK